MPIAKMLPSGNWRVRVYDYTDADGKSHYKSFTGPTKKAAEKLAANYDPPDRSSRSDMTFEECAELYIESRSPVLSPSTVMGYQSILKNHLTSLKKIKLYKLTAEDIQREINKDALHLSPKTVRNIHGFISAVLSVYRPEFKIHTALPKKVQPKLHIPTDAEVQKIMDVVKGTSLELPVLLAAFGPMRRGEISALRAENIQGNVVHVCESMVKTKSGEWVIKPPKSFAGDRYIEYPDFVAEYWKNAPAGRVVKICPSTISHAFTKARKKAGVPDVRFHDLRHYSASIQHALGVPDAYIMERGGWKSDAALKNVYRHSLEDKAREMSSRINKHFTALHDTNS